MFYSTRLKIVVSFLAVALIGGTVSLLVGTRLLYTAVLNEARMRVSLDLNAAREIYNNRLREIKTTFPYYLRILRLGRHSRQEKPSLNPGSKLPEKRRTPISRISAPATP
jgi:hypothetical protein